MPGDSLTQIVQRSVQIVQGRGNEKGNGNYWEEANSLGETP